MKLEDQVLSIEQVQELQELGFDVNKYASMCWVTYTSDEEPYEKEYSLSILDEFCYESASLEPTPTMSIGDIIDILPENIDNNFFLMFEKDYVAYNNRYLVLMSKEEKNLITALFETLKWCIKEKHINL